MLSCLLSVVVVDVSVYGSCGLTQPNEFTSSGRIFTSLFLPTKDFTTACVFTHKRVDRQKTNANEELLLPENTMICRTVETVHTLVGVMTM